LFWPVFAKTTRELLKTQIKLNHKERERKGERQQEERQRKFGFQHKERERRFDFEKEKGEVLFLRKEKEVWF